ncbi:tocopherol cyclase family protein [Acetobacterium carbinolicum]|uniref:tocopherol cyclase family protein n=1 Tax=Acetobacterium carbinolicum TaxID=52690 RepID=UPI0039C993E0
MNKSDLSRNLYMLKGPLAQNGYDWWWHNFTGYHQISGEPRTFFIEYFVCNPVLGGDAAVLGQLPQNKRNGVKPSYAMIKVGTWGGNACQINTFYPISQFFSAPEQLNIKVGPCTLTEHHMNGSCRITPQQAQEHPEYMTDAGEMSWNINIDKKIAYHVGYGASALLRKINAFEMFWHAEGIKTEYSGEVMFNGEPYEIIPNTSYGYADKNWGADFTSPWLWISSCHMRSLLSGKILSNSAVEFGGGRPKIYGYSLNRKILGGLYYEGQLYDYNFTKFWNRSKVDFSFNEGTLINTWNITASNKESIMELHLECPVEEMLFINYEAPSGKKLHNRLWNGGTGYGTIKLYQKHGQDQVMIDHIEIRNTGCEYGEYSS